MISNIGFYLTILYYGYHFFLLIKVCIIHLRNIHFKYFLLGKCGEGRPWCDGELGIDVLFSYKIQYVQCNGSLSRRYRGENF